MSDLEEQTIIGLQLKYFKLQQNQHIMVWAAWPLNRERERLTYQNWVAALFKGVEISSSTYMTMFTLVPWTDKWNVEI
jgi:hypothetical protein